MPIGEDQFSLCSHIYVNMKKSMNNEFCLLHFCFRSIIHNEIPLIKAMLSLFYVLHFLTLTHFFKEDTVYRIWSKQFLNKLSIWTLSMQGGKLPSSCLLLLKVTGVYVETRMAAGTLAS